MSFDILYIQGGIFLARKITENKDESIIRLSDGAFEQVLINKSKGKFYYIGENAVKFIDNSKGKMLISNYKSIEDLIIKLNKR